MVLGPHKSVNITVQDVSDVLKVPSEGIVINFFNRRSTPNWKYCIRDIKRDLLTNLLGINSQKLFRFLHVLQYLYRIVLNKRVFEIYRTKFGMVIHQFKGTGQA